MNANGVEWLCAITVAVGKDGLALTVWTLRPIFVRRGDVCTKDIR